MKSSFLFMLFLFTLINLGCNDDDSTSVCSEELVCTLIFISYDVTVNDTNGAPIALDGFSVTDIDTGEDLTRNLTEDELELAKSFGSYPLYDDLTDANNLGISRQILFQGFLGNETITAEYKVGRDCCHASTPEGNLNLIWE